MVHQISREALSPSIFFRIQSLLTRIIGLGPHAQKGTSRLDVGKVTLLPRNDACLSPQQIKAGQTLACRARPRSDLTVTWLSRAER